MSHSCFPVSQPCGVACLSAKKDELGLGGLRLPPQKRNNCALRENPSTNRVAQLAQLCLKISTGTLNQGVVNIVPDKAWGAVT